MTAIGPVSALPQTGFTTQSAQRTDIPVTVLARGRTSALERYALPPGSSEWRRSCFRPDKAQCHAGQSRLNTMRVEYG